MIIGYDFFNSIGNEVFDTALPTSRLDDLIMNSGIYDEMFITLDTEFSKANDKPVGWFLKNIMHAKFEGDLESGSLDADGHIITDIQIYRRIYGDGTNTWTLLGQFKYNNDYNTYSFVDITAENNTTYEYAIVPVANEIVGEKNISEPVLVEYNGTFISDNQNNYRIQFDFEQGDVSYNKDFAEMKPLNGEYPVVIYGNQNYRTGHMSFLPLSDRQIRSKGTKIDGKEERTLRDKVTNFLNNGKSKVFRNDNGDIFIMATSNIKSSPKSPYLPDIQSVSFDYTELGKINSESIVRTGLLGDVVRSTQTFDEYGNVIWDIGGWHKWQLKKGQWMTLY